MTRTNTRPNKRQTTKRTLASIVAAGALCLVAAAQSAHARAEELRYRAAVEAPYEDVVEDLHFAISQENFRITGGNEIGGAIARRHELSGFPRSEVVHFCNLEYARRFVEAAPDFLLHMPCKVVVFESEGKVVVEARMLPSADARVQALASEVNAILKRIVDSATE